MCLDVVFACAVVVVALCVPPCAPYVLLRVVLCLLPALLTVVLSPTARFESPRVLWCFRRRAQAKNTEPRKLYSSSAAALAFVCEFVVYALRARVPISWLLRIVAVCAAPRDHTYFSHIYVVF